MGETVRTTLRHNDLAGADSMSIEVNDSVLRKLIKRITGSPSRVQVGVLSGKGAEQKVDGKLTMAGLAAIHEFGTKDIPERSFIRSSFNPPSADQEKLQKVLAKKIYTGMRVSNALDLLGVWGAAHVQERISKREIKQELSPRTVAKKKSETALIDTGRLRQSISHKVVK